MERSSASPGAAPVRIGLAALCADWFRQVGLNAESGDLSSMLQKDYERMASFLREGFGEVVAPGIIATVAEAASALESFRQARIDTLVLVHIVWNEDQPLLELLRGCQNVPIILWNYHPTGSLPAKLTVNEMLRMCGTVGMLQGSAVFQRLGISVPIVAGTPGDPRLLEDLREYAAALAIRRRFQGMPAGILAGRCEAMTGTFVNAEALRTELGVRLVEIGIEEYAACCESVAEQRVAAFCDQLRGEYKIADVSAESLQLACRNTLALGDLVVRHGSGALAFQDLNDELHRQAGIRPCLCPPVAAKRGVAIGMESDLNTTLGMAAAMQAGAAPAMYTEIFTYDPQQNTLLMGHAGVHDPRLAAPGGVTIVPDEEYRHVDRLEGAWLEYIFAPGPVTCVSMYDTGKGYRMTVFEGQSLGPPLRLQSYAHALVRPEPLVGDLLPALLARGVTQHFAVVPGRISSVLEKWCKLSGVQFYWEKGEPHKNGLRC